MSSCAAVCMKTCFNSYTSALLEMNIFSLFVIIIAAVVVLCFICTFWYLFTLHDFGQNEWEEKVENKAKNVIKEDSETSTQKGKDREEEESMHPQNVDEIKQGICEVVIERPYYVEKRMYQYNALIIP